MIAYDNSDYFRVLCQTSGSVIPTCLPAALLSFACGLTMSVCREMDVVMDDLGDYLEHPLGIRTIATVTGLLLAMRTGMALDRWMDGISQVQLMLSKWGDAFIALSAFFSQKQGDEETLQRILHFRVRIAHWFSLMSCLAFATLRGRHLTSLDEVPIREMFIQENEWKPAKSFTSERGAREKEGHLDDLLMSGQAEQSSCLSELDLLVLAAPSKQEVQLLELATDKVNAVYLWIIQGISEEIRAKTLDTPPPIVSRVFQEVSNGKLGFSQAHKVAMVPFPFPFAQMIGVLLVIVMTGFPMYIELFTKNKFLSPFLCFLVPICYFGLNRVAVELEEPFGTDWNDVDIEIRHEEFLWLLVDNLRMSLIAPGERDDKDYGKTEEKILAGCSHNVESKRLDPEILRYLEKKRREAKQVDPAKRPQASQTSCSSEMSVSSGFVASVSAEPAEA